MRQNFREETISDIDENEDAETEVTHSLININKTFEIVCRFLLEQ